MDLIPVHTVVQGSWKRKLRQKFKNLRRPARARKAGITVPPPAKKKKDEGSIEPSGSIGPSLSDLAEYDQHINHIQKCYSSQKWSVASMTQLLQETAVERRRWIREDCPSVKEVLLKFPCLTEPKLVSDIMQRPSRQGAYVCMRAHCTVPLRYKCTCTRYSACVLHAHMLF